MVGSETSPSLIAAASPRSATSPHVNWFQAHLANFCVIDWSPSPTNGSRRRMSTRSIHRRYGEAEDNNMSTVATHLADWWNNVAKSKVLSAFQRPSGGTETRMVTTGTYVG
jgi:hypothetical protein